jgi:hypothetical protein
MASPYPDYQTSYVAERQGGGPQDLLRGFESFRNCNQLFNMATMVRPMRVVFSHRPFYFSPGGRYEWNPLGMGSLLVDRSAGIRSTRARSGTRQGIRSGAITRTLPPAAVTSMRIESGRGEKPITCAETEPAPNNNPKKR